VLQALHSVENKPKNTVDIIVHITEALEENRRQDLVTALKNMRRVSFLLNSVLHATT